MINNYTPLRAQTVSGEYNEFDLTAAPTIIDNEKFVLMLQEGSPVMYTNTVCAGSDIPDVFEGVIIKGNDNKEYTVSYRRGFAAMDESRHVYKLHKLAPFIVLDKPATVSSFCRARLSYKYANITFQFKDIVGAIQNDILVQNKHTPIVLPDIKQAAGVTHNGARVFFGDTIDGKCITMHLGRVCLYDGSSYVDITDGEEIPLCL